MCFNLHDNDNRLIKCAKEKTMQVMSTAGATEVVQEARYAHLVRAARIGKIRASRRWTSSAERMIFQTCSYVTARFCRRRARPIRADDSVSGRANCGLPDLAGLGDLQQPHFAD